MISHVFLTLDKNRIDKKIVIIKEIIVELFTLLIIWLIIKYL